MVKQEKNFSTKTKNYPQWVYLKPDNPDYQLAIQNGCQPWGRNKSWAKDQTTIHISVRRLTKLKTQTAKTTKKTSPPTKSNSEKTEKWIWLAPTDKDYWLAQYHGCEPSPTKQGERIKIAPKKLTELKEKPLSRQKQYLYLSHWLATWFSISPKQALEEIWETGNQFERESGTRVSENLTAQQVANQTAIRLLPKKQQIQLVKAWSNSLSQN